MNKKVSYAYQYLSRTETNKTSTQRGGRSGAGYGSRTRLCSLGSCHSTDELIPRGEHYFIIFPWRMQPFFLAAREKYFSRRCARLRRRCAAFARLRQRSLPSGRISPVDKGSSWSYTRIPRYWKGCGSVASCSPAPSAAHHRRHCAAFSGDALSGRLLRRPVSASGASGAARPAGRAGGRLQLRRPGTRLGLRGGARRGEQRPGHRKRRP